MTLGSRFAIALQLFVGFVMGATLLRAQELPKAPQAQVFTLTPTPGFFTEPSVAVNPAHPEQVVAVFQDNVHAAYSSDAGHTWNVEDAAPKNYRISGDVSTTFDNQGHAFVCYIAFDRLGTFNYWAHGATRNGIFIRRSLDGGKTWEADHIPVAEQKSEPGIPFEDKPYIVADNTKSKYAGNLYIGWTRWRIADSQMVLSRSTDDGKTWSEPVEIDAHPGLPRDDNGAAEGFDGVVAPDGKLYAIWSQDDEIMLTSSRDGGKTFSRARAVIHTAPIMFAIQTLERANGFPQIAIDPKSKRLYITWSDYRNGDLDVFIATSDDGGKRWSDPVRVNNDPVHDGAEQFFQWLAVDPTDGAVNVLFYDRRGDPQNRKQIVVLARSTDGGNSFANYAWMNDPFEASGVFFGDYTGLAAYGGRVYGVWMEKPAQQTETAEKKPEEGKDEKDAKPAKPKPPGTIVKVGTADFNGKAVGHLELAKVPAVAPSE
ncbi:MAG TPA: sialidase family protein [Terriglobales bacterium]|nr:sialidase family protein [Terriglobales bacterium]